MKGRGELLVKPVTNYRLYGVEKGAELILLKGGETGGVFVNKKLDE